MPSGLSAPIAILGLVIRQPDTRGGLGARLAKEYSHARFARSAPKNALLSLEKQGFVRCPKKTSQPWLDRYEATPEGVEHFRAWRHGSSEAVPVIRDALRAKLEHVSEEADLRAQIKEIRAQERACETEAAAAHTRLAVALRRKRERSTGETDRKAKVRFALLIYDTVVWDQLATRLKRLREDLEEDDEESTIG